MINPYRETGGKPWRGGGSYSGDGNQQMPNQALPSHEPMDRDEFTDAQYPRATASPGWMHSLRHDSGKTRSRQAESPLSPPPASFSAYTPLADADTASARRGGGRKSSIPTFRRPKCTASIQEEEFSLSLLRSAGPMGRSLPYEAIPEREEPVDTRPAFDITSAMGPMSSHDPAFVKELQAQEARGILTGGLGHGIHPESRMRDTELLAGGTLGRGSLIRSFTHRKPIRVLTRKETIQHKAQHEANRRGQVIEVILDEPPTDISNFDGSHTAWDSDGRRSTLISEAQKTQTFYPQPNWRPWPMRLPYMTLVIVLSLVLAVVQEVLLRKYQKVHIVRFRRPAEVKPSLYFVVKFVPTLSAVVYGVLWQFIDFEVRRLEAFYQLSKQGGALAAGSINVDYVTSFDTLRPFRALKLGHYAVALSSVATTLAISLVPTFASASVILSPNREERLKHPENNKFLTISPTWSRLLTGTLVVCAACGIGLLFTLQSRRTGLLSDVRGIAGLASMAVVSHILMDFKDMDTAKHREIHQRLKRNRYLLRNSSLAPDDNNDTLAISKERGQDEETHLSENPHPLMLRPLGFIPFFVTLLGFTGFVPAFLFTRADVVVRKAPWLITAIAVGLKMGWNALETAVRMMEPYYILYKRHAPPAVLTLDYTSMPFGYLPLRALLNSHVIVFLVGFGSIVAEFLTILVAGLATVDGKDFLADFEGGLSQDGSRLNNAGQETLASFSVSLSIVMFILIYMGVVSCLVFLRRRHAFLPRQPNTIASVLAFIHQSKMLYDFVGTEKMSHAQIARKLDDGKKYGLGWFQGRDGQIHCGVDQEELTSSYKHGVDCKQRNQPWNSQWDVL